MNDTEETILTVTEVAALFKLHTKTVYRLLELGQIPGARIGRSWRCKRSDVLKLVGGNGHNNNGRKDKE